MVLFRNFTSLEVFVGSRIGVRTLSTSPSSFKRFYSNSTTNTKNVLKIGVQSAEFGGGQRLLGVEEGPMAIKRTGFIDELNRIGNVTAQDYGTIDIPAFTPGPNEPDAVVGTNNVLIRNVKQVGVANKAISDSVVEILKKNDKCITLGGDHSIGIGTVHGTSEVYNDLAVLWVDAHCDINTVATSLTGNIHGMSLAFLVQELQPFMDKLEAYSWITPRIKAKNLAYIGLRDVDPLEREILNHLGITAFSMREVDKLGIKTVTDLALEKITDNGKRPLHVSVDIDAVDGAEVPSTIIPLPGGLTVRESLAMMEQINLEANLVSMDLVEVNPRLGNEKDLARTTLVAKQILLSSFGYYRGGVSQPEISLPGRISN